MSGLFELLEEKESIQTSIDFLDNDLEGTRKGSELYHYIQTTKLQLSVALVIIKEEIKSHLN